MNKVQPVAHVFSPILARSPLMIVYNLDGKCVTILPNKANAPLIIDANAVLTKPITFEGFEAIPRQRTEIIQSCRGC